MKNITITALFFLSACAAVPTTTVRTLDEKASVTVIAKDLRDAIIAVDRGVAFTLTDEDLDKFRFGVLGVSDVSVGFAFPMIGAFTLVAYLYAAHLLRTGKRLRT